MKASEIAPGDIYESRGDRRKVVAVLSAGENRKALRILYCMTNSRGDQWGLSSCAVQTFTRWAQRRVSATAS